MLAGVLEGEARPYDEIPDGRGNEHLAGASECGNASAYVHGDPANAIARQLHLPRVHAGADSIPRERTACISSKSASHPSSWSVEPGEEAIARGIDLYSARTRQLVTNDLVMTFDEIAPGVVTELHCLLRGPDDVGEQDAGEHAVG